MYTIGWFIKKVELIIWFVANFGLDLAPFFFPLPFYNFYQAQLMTRHYRFFHGRYRIRLHAGHADSYFLWLLEKILNFVTLSLYKNIMGETFPKWLDSKLQWIGEPPPGFNNHFRVFHNNGTLCERLSYYLQVRPCACLSACLPACLT